MSSHASPVPTDLAPYLVKSTHLDWQHPDVLAKAQQLAMGCHSLEAIANHCFMFVRDQIKHSWDYRLNPVTCKASDVLHFGTGYCYAKSHLLAALLRANGIPAGLCYQRLTITDVPPFCLHGLNAIYLEPYGWYRVDARGNKAGIDAQFTPPIERLAFPTSNPHEYDLPDIWTEPHPAVIQVLERYPTVEAVYANLPDAA